MTERYDAAPSQPLRARYHAALSDARSALVTLAHTSSETVASITEAVRAEAPDRARSARTNVERIKAAARALASIAVNLMWKQQPVATELDIILTMYELAIDYERLADDLSHLAADVLHADGTMLHNAPPHVRELADAALRASSSIHQGLRDGTAAPLLRANTERVIADAVYADGIAELQHALLTRSMTAEHGCSLLSILLSFQRVIHQAATAARHGRTFLADIG